MFTFALARELMKLADTPEFIAFIEITFIQMKTDVRNH
jgi:hypothetical protein